MARLQPQRPTSRMNRFSSSSHSALLVAGIQNNLNCISQTAYINVPDFKRHQGFAPGPQEHLDLPNASVRAPARLSLREALAPLGTPRVLDLRYYSAGTRATRKPRK